jgi:hypothetical protein
MPDRRELYRSPNGDTWFLGREPTSGHAFIIHQPNAPSGGRLSHIELGEFLRSGNGPEQQALLRLIATLVEVPRGRVAPPRPLRYPRAQNAPAGFLGARLVRMETNIVRLAWRW